MLIVFSIKHNRQRTKAYPLKNKIYALIFVCLEKKYITSGSKTNSFNTSIYSPKPMFAELYIVGKMSARTVAAQATPHINAHILVFPPILRSLIFLLLNTINIASIIPPASKYLRMDKTEYPNTVRRNI